MAHESGEEIKRIDQENGTPAGAGHGDPPIEGKVVELAARKALLAKQFAFLKEKEEMDYQTRAQRAAESEQVTGTVNKLLVPPGLTHEEWQDIRDRALQGDRAAVKLFDAHATMPAEGTPTWWALQLLDQLHQWTMTPEQQAVMSKYRGRPYSAERNAKGVVHCLEALKLAA